MSNQEKNLEICQKLTEFFSDPKNRDLRFFQALSNMGAFKQQFDDRLNCVGVDDPYYISNDRVIKLINEEK